MKLRFLGAAGTVTGSRFRVESEASALWVDCGLFQGSKVVRQKNWNALSGRENLSAVVLTHAHVDHCGLLPVLVRDGFEGPIYCSPATADLCALILRDAAHLQEEDARFLAERKLSHFDPPKPLYTTIDAERALAQLRPVGDGAWIGERGLEFRLSPSAHILGSRFVEVRDEKTSILFTGDVGPAHPLLLKPRERPPAADYLVIESTYGNRNHAPGNRLDQLAEAVNRVVGRGGTLVIPAFSVGRTQDLLHLFAELRKQGRMPSVPVYVDSPMALEATSIYGRHPGELAPSVALNPLGDYKAVLTADESMLLCMDTSPKIVISAAGMLNGGRVLHHLRMRLPEEKSGVLFVGYQAEGTKGALLLGGLRKIRIHHLDIEVQAEILSMQSLSAHADSDGLVDWSREWGHRPRTAFVIHGENAAREALAYRFRHELGWDAEVPAENDESVLG